MLSEIVLIQKILGSWLGLGGELGRNQCHAGCFLQDKGIFHSFFAVGAPGEGTMLAY